MSRTIRIVSLYVPHQSKIGVQKGKFQERVPILGFDLFMRPIGEMTGAPRALSIEDNFSLTV